MRTLLALGCATVLPSAILWAQTPPDSDPLAELAALGNSVAEAEVEGGGSIRAKKEGDTAKLQRLNAPDNVEARVEAVTQQKFPLVAIKIKISKPGKAGKGTEMAKDQVLVVIPKLKAAGAHIDLTDADTVTNAGAYYLKKGDKVAVKLGAQTDKAYWADYIERK